MLYRLTGVDLITVPSLRIRTGQTAHPSPPFRDLRAEAEYQRVQERALAHRRKRAATLGLRLVEAPARATNR